MGLPSRARARGRAPAKDMAWVPGGGFLMGSDEFYPEERPARRVEVDGFWVDDHPVTVAEFGLFVSATRYVTVAERPLDPADYLDADPALLILDEPTAHLDRDTGHALMSDLLAATEGRATLLITHDLDGLDQFDQIVVLEHGKVVERGTHAQLVHAGGSYQEMWQAGR